MQDDGAGLHEARRIAQRGRTTDLGQQVAFGLSVRVALEAAGQQAVQHRAFGRDASGAGKPAAGQGVAAAVIAVVRFQMRRAGRIEAQKARGAVDASGRGVEETGFGAQRSTFVQDGVDAGLGQLDVRGLACGCLEARPVIGMDRQAQFVGRYRLPMGADVTPELALGMNDAAMAFGQILAHTLRHLHVRPDIEALAACVGLVRAEQVSPGDPVANGLLALAQQHVVEVLILGRCRDHHHQPAQGEGGGGAGDHSLGLAARRIAIAGDDHRGFVGNGRAADVRDAETGPDFLTGGLPDRQRGFDTLAEHQRFAAGQTNGGTFAPALDRLIGALDGIDRGLLPLGGKIDLLDGQHLARRIGRQRDHRAIAAISVPAKADE